MAEFQEVLRQLNRMCSHYKNCEDSGCPLFDECGNIGAYASNAKHAMRIEKIVKDWVADHPEPVYPSWIEWLKSVGVVPYLARYVAKRDDGGNYLNGYVYVNEIASKPIPADFAKKHNIQPVEVAK